MMNDTKTCKTCVHTEMSCFGMTRCKITKEETELSDTCFQYWYDAKKESDLHLPLTQPDKIELKRG